MLQRYQRNHPDEVDFTEPLKNLDSCLDELPNKTKVSTVVGLEGRASAIYFEAFGKMFRKDIQFTIRTRRPPQDPVNSLLSLGYTLITNEMFSLTSAIGFDPYIGFLHGVDYGRPSLALDLIEEFRHAIVDRLTLELINKEILTRDDFEEKEGGIYLKEEPRKKYFAQYEKRMLTSFQDEETKEEINFRKMFLKQAQIFAKTIQERVSYKPFLIK
jgi:CRISPR-associated protein Cas1